MRIAVCDDQLEVLNSNSFFKSARCAGGSSLLGWIGAIGMKDGLAESYR